MKWKNFEADRLLYFQIGLIVTLALALYLVNYETPMPEYVSSETEVLGLDIVPSQLTDTSARLSPPELKK